MNTANNRALTWGTYMVVLRRSVSELKTGLEKFVNGLVDVVPIPLWDPSCVARAVVLTSVRACATLDQEWERADGETDAEWMRRVLAQAQQRFETASSPFSEEVSSALGAGLLSFLTAESFSKEERAVLDEAAKAARIAARSVCAVHLTRSHSADDLEQRVRASMRKIFAGLLEEMYVNQAVAVHGRSADTSLA